MISSLEKIEKINDYVTVRAVVENSVLTYAGSYYDPPEYGPAMCETSFYLTEDEKLPEDEDGLIDYLNDLDLDWRVLPKDWDY